MYNETLERLHVELANVTQGVCARELKCIALLKDIYVKVHAGVARHTDAALMERVHTLLCERMGDDHMRHFHEEVEALRDEYGM